MEEVQGQRIWTKTGQLGMFDVQPPRLVSDSLRELLVWNVARPSVSRAETQAAWLLKQDVDLMVLTETSPNEGCELLQGHLTEAGYCVVASIPPAKKLGTIIAAKGPVTPSHFVRQLQQLPYRAASVYLESEHIEVVGVYVPSRDGKASDLN